MPCYQLRISKRAKYARITIQSNHQIEVVLPLGMPAYEADKLVQQQQQWIARTLHRMHQQGAVVHNDSPQLIELLAIDQSIRVTYIAKQEKLLVWHKDQAMLSVCNHNTSIPPLLRQWLKCYAKQYLPSLLQSIAEEMHVNYQAVSIRLQKSRWGSCSMKRNISLNAKLLLMPPDLVRYVLVHELSHLKHMNHSPSFWQSVERFEPDYRARRHALRQLTMQLPSWTHG